MYFNNKTAKWVRMVYSVVGYIFRVGVAYRCLPVAYSAEGVLLPRGRRRLTKITCRTCDSHVRVLLEQHFPRNRVAAEHLWR